METGEFEFPTFESFKVWFDGKTQDHPLKTGKLGRFYEDFVQGKAPIELLREYAKQYYIFIQMTNAGTTWILVHHMDLWRRYPDLYDIVAAKMGTELADPGPGGHGRTYVKYARYIGLKDEELFHTKPIPEMEVRFNQITTNYFGRPAHMAVTWMLEGFVGYDLKFWRETLHEKYGIPDDILEYFDIHVQADLEEHGPEGAMLLERLYKLGLVNEEDHFGMGMRVERAVQGAHPGSQNYWRDAIYHRYYKQVAQ